MMTLSRKFKIISKLTRYCSGFDDFKKFNDNQKAIEKAFGPDGEISK
jgi:hypothetical protein